MRPLFEGLVFQKIELEQASFDLPILYFREDSFALFFSASVEKVRKFLPSQNLRPVLLSKKKAVVVIAAFNYVETSIGPYGELGIAIPVVHMRRPLPVLPLIRESSCKGFGMWVAHLPVTTTVAKEAGRQVWGYPKFVADMDFKVFPEYIECTLSEKQQHILTVRAPRKGLVRKDNKPLITYSVADGNLIKTTIEQRAIYMMDLLPDNALLDLGEHPVAQFLRELEISQKPFASRIYLYRAAVLPKGEVVEKGVSPWKGYLGEDREGSFRIHFTRV